MNRMVRLFTRTLFLVTLTLTTGFRVESHPAPTAVDVGLSSPTGHDTPALNLAGPALTCTVTGESCPGKADGAIDLTISGAVNLQTISWSTGATTEDLSGLLAGTYTVTVTDDNGTSTLGITVGYTTASPVGTISGSATVAQNSGTAPVVISASGGVAPYVAWFTKDGGSNLQTTSFTSSITLNQSTTSTGTHVYKLVGIEDANGCTWPASGSATISIVAATTGPTLTYTVTDVTCPSNADGAIDLTISGAVNLKTISWSTGATTEDISGLAAGTYTVTVTDDNGTSTLNITVGTNASAPAATISGSTTVCQNSGTAPVTITVTGGVGPFKAHYTRNGGAELNLSGISATGSLNQSTTSTGTYVYQLTGVTDNNGCRWPASGSATVVVSSAATVNDPGITGFCQGELTTAIPLTGTPSGVVFDITGGAAIGLSDRTGVTAIPSFTALAGTATLTITPRLTGCTGTPLSIPVTVSPRAGLSVTPMVQSICSGNTSSIALSSSTSGAQISWVVKSISPAGSVTGSTNGTGSTLAQTLVNTGASTATVVYTVTAALGGCEGTSIDVTVKVQPVVQGTISVVGSSCQTATDPVITFTAVNGTAPYTFSYRINGGAVQTVTSATTTAQVTQTAATAGNFVYELLSIKDQSGCSSVINATATVAVNTLPELTSTLTPTGICSNEIFAYTPTFNIPGTTYTWHRPAISGIWNPDESDSTEPDEYLINTTNDPIPVTYTFTLTSPDGCVNTQDVVVMVTKMPELTSSLTPQNICSSTVFSYTPTSNISQTNYPWTRPAVTGIANPAASGTGNPNERLVNTTSSPVGVTYFYTLNSNGCMNPFIYAVYVVVMPEPKVTVSASKTEICPGESVDLYSTSPVIKTVSGTLLSETFNSASSGATTGPNGWTTSWTNSNTAWTVRPNGYSIPNRTFHSNDNSLFYLANSSAGPNNTVTTSILRSPAVDTRGYQTLNLSFWQYYRSGGNSDFPYVQVSTDGSNWTTVKEFTTDDGSSGSFVQNTLNLNGYVGQATVYIRFYFEGNKDYYWALDNIELSGSGIGTDMYWTSSPAGFTSTDQNPTGVTPTQTTDYIAWYADPDTGCLGSDTVTVTVNDPPVPTITADYCNYQPYIRLCAPSGYASYSWSVFMQDGTTASLGTSSCIDADLAATYTVSVVDANGCTGSSSFRTATELVVNGDFELGPAGRTTFYTDYGFRTATGSLGGGLYGIGTDARPYYTAFRGAHDHTSGSGYYMIVDGTESSKVVWQQTFTVEPNTDYYFSAWALNIYLISATGYNPHLQFSINGTLIGSDVLLNKWTNNDINPWLPEFRFYGTWNSGSATTAVVQIRDLETSPNQNDFGLDDISFGTLEPRPAEVNPTSAGDICEGGSISLSANVQYGREPITYLWTGPNGFSSTDENPVITNATTAASGTYTVQVWDTYGCADQSKTVSVTVFPPVVTDAGPDLQLCSGFPSITLAGSISGGVTTGTWSGGSGTFSPDNRTLNASYSPSAAEMAAGTVTLTLTSDDPAGPCPATSNSMTITIYPTIAVAFDLDEPLCHNGNDGQITATASNGLAPYTYVWSDGQTSATAIGLSAGTHSVTVTDARGCSVTQPVVLTDPAEFHVHTPIFTQPTCYGATDGTATITATGGTPPYQFIWDPAAGSQTSATATGLGAGTYKVIVVSDANGCEAEAVAVTIAEPAAPDLTCPANVTATVDPGKTFASNVAVAAPDYDNFCQSIDYKMSGATTTPGTISGLVPSTYTFNQGVTTITYTTVNLKGEALTCSFTVTVTGENPDITCANPLSVNTDAGACSASVAISLPVVNSGAGLSWSWEMSGATTGSGTGPIVSPYPFNTGTTTIKWTASNTAGTVTCQQTVTVTDHEPPTFAEPADWTVCVDRLKDFTASSKVYSDYFTFEPGNTALDLDLTKFADNCDQSCGMTIEWRMVFSTGGSYPASGWATGQPSTVGSSFRIPGDSAGKLPLIHSVYYRITDCAGNKSTVLDTAVTVTARPQVD